MHAQAISDSIQQSDTNSIIDARVIVTCPGRNFVTLKITTSSGMYGIGDATVNGREQSVVAYLQEYVIPCIIGRDANQIEDIWQYLYRGCYWRRGPITMAAISAVDVALWDIKAKLANMPLYQLLGGASRNGVMVYGHANGVDMEEAIDEVGKYIDKGYKAIRVQTGIPGLKSTYGVSSDKMFYEPADGELPSENSWNSSKYLRYVPKLFAKLRDTYGFEVELLHDVHHRLTPNQLAQLGKSLESYSLFWLEDGVTAENQANLRHVRNHTTTPLAIGEIFNTVWDSKDIIQEQLIDYIRSTIPHAGGITHMRVIANLASLHQVRTGCHGPTDVSPISMGALAHFDTAIHNFGIQEYMLHTDQINEVFPHNHYLENGMLYIKPCIGHGVDIDETLASKYPYSRSMLPVNRLEDGAMHDW